MKNLIFLPLFVTLFAIPTLGHAELQREYPVFTDFGPNCWSFVLVHSKAHKYYRTVSLSEFWHYMKSSKCKLVKKPQKGDIGSLILPKHGLVHSFIYLDSKTAISKGSPYPQEQIGREDLGLIRKAPGASIDYRRCDFSTEDRQEWSATELKLQRIEEQLNDHFTNKTRLSSDQIIHLTKVVLDLEGDNSITFEHSRSSVLMNLFVLSPNEGFSSQQSEEIKIWVKKLRKQDDILLQSFTK